MNTGSVVELTTTSQPITQGLSSGTSICGPLGTRFGQICSDFELIDQVEDKHKAKLQLGDGATRMRIEIDQDLTLTQE